MVGAMSASALLLLLGSLTLILSAEVAFSTTLAICGSLREYDDDDDDADMEGESESEYLPLELLP